MIVLRIENEFGAGCYINHGSDKGARAAHNFGGCPMDDQFHPCPDEDFKLSAQWDDIVRGSHPHISGVQNRFGFASVEQFHRWFYTPEARAILSREHFAVSVYDVPEQYVAIGGSQVVYDRRFVNLLGRFPCDLTVEDADDAVARIKDHPESPFPNPALGYTPPKFAEEEPKPGTRRSKPNKFKPVYESALAFEVFA